MDNPWANGWADEHEKPVLKEQKPITTWSPSHLHSASEEIDLSTPSCVPGAGIKWTEPSETQGSLWSQNIDSVHLDAWGSSTYNGISLGRLTPEPPSLQEEGEALPPLS